MKSIIAMLLVGALSLAALAYAQSTIEATKNEDGSVTVTLSPEAAQQCKEQGGCGIFTAQYLQGVMKAAVTKACGKAL